MPSPARADRPVRASAKGRRTAATLAGLFLLAALAGCTAPPPSVDAGIELRSTEVVRTAFEGQAAFFPVTVRNAGNATQEVTLEVLPGSALPGGVEPPRLVLPANATADAQAWFGPAPAPGGGVARQSVEVGLRAVVDGEEAASLRWNVELRAPTLELETPILQRTAVPGSMVGFPVVLRNTGTESLTATLHPALEVPWPMFPSPAEVRVPARGEAGAFVTFDLRDATGPGLHRLTVAAQVSGGVAATATLTVQLREPAAPARAGDTVMVDYIGRLPNGTLFDTTLRGIATGPYLVRAPIARAAFDPMDVTLAPDQGTIEGFWRGLVGLGEGQTRTVVLDPWNAYGNETRTLTFPRRQEVQRVEALPRVQVADRAALEEAGVLNESSERGDQVTLRNPAGGTRTYRIGELGEREVALVWAIEEGENTTLFPVWPMQSTAIEVGEEEVVFRTTPLRAHNLTWFTFWPRMTTLIAGNDTTLVIQHDPPAGLNFTLPTVSTTRNSTVTAVTREQVVIEAPNTHPFAGERLVFDLTLRSVARRGGA